MTEVLMRFERDEEKNRINREKHGLSFKLATKVFEDKLRIERYDTSPGNTAGENRTQTIGSIGNVIFVVFTQRGENTRIISARKASLKERRLYYGYEIIQSEGWERADS